MALIRRTVIVLVTLVVGIPASLAQGDVVVIRAASASYAHVSAAVAAANPGDIVEVPAGTATWSQTLIITKRITLKGAGIGQTVIIGNVGSSNYIISYKPTDALSSEAFRLTGFTLDANNNSRLFEINRTSISPTYVRLDNNHFKAATSFIPAAEIKGVIYGVIDNNTFDGAIHIDNYGLQVNSWKQLVYIPGSADNLYYEDNTFNPCFTGDTGGHGGRYVKRYNTYNLKNPANCFASLSGFYPLFDAHGNQKDGVYTTMGVEIYGNRVNSSYNIGPFLDQRGGKAFVFFNKVVSTGSTTTRVREEYDDSISAPATNPTDGSPQHVNGSYYWNNRAGATGTTLFHTAVGEDVPNVLEENDDFFNHNTSFNGASGVGCGTLANRPTSCSIGVGYWATEQSCSSTNDTHVGRNASTPLAGVLVHLHSAKHLDEASDPLHLPSSLARCGGNDSHQAQPAHECEDCPVRTRELFVHRAAVSSGPTRASRF